VDALEDDFAEQHLMAMAGWDLAVADAQEKASKAAGGAQGKPLYGAPRGMNG
jgi:hypothetical protein